MVAGRKSEVRRTKGGIELAGSVLSLVLLAALAIVLTCRKWDNPYDPLNNSPPAPPSNPSPDSGAVLVGIRPQLSWTSVDPDYGDTARFDVYLDTASFDLRNASHSPDTSKRLCANWPHDTLSTLKLSFASRYYWQVLARDNLGVDTIGPVWCFTTRDTNHAPDAPHSPTPADSSFGLMLHTVISWSCGDPDSADVLTYDVYFGSVDSQPLARQGQQDTFYAPVDLQYDSPYCWRVVARDESGDSTAGPLWQFRTAAPIRVTAPDTGEELRMYAVDTIAWTGGPGQGRIQFSASRPGLRPPVVKSIASGRKRLIASRPDAADSTVVYRSSDDGATWLRLGLVIEPGRFVWQVPEPATESARVMVRAFASGDTMAGTSGRFTVSDTLPPPPIQVTSPDSTSVWAIGSVHDVTWTGGTDGVDSSVVYFSPDDGMTWARQGMAVTQGIFTWTVPGPATSLALVEVRAYHTSGVTTGRSGAFSIVEPPYPDTVIATVAVGPYPSALCWDSTDNRVFVSSYSDADVTVIDGASNAVIGSIGVGGFSSSLVWNPHENKVYAASATGNTVTIIDGATLAVLDTVPVGSKPVAICWNRTNNKVYVANNRDSSVTIIDGSTNEVVATAAVGASPTALAWNSVNNTVYVASFGAATASAIDGASNGVTPIALSYYYACAVVVDTADNEIYVAHQNDERVSVIDGASNTVLTSTPVDQQPWALAWNGSLNRVYCANSQAASVTVINPANHGVVADVPVAQQPRALWWAWQVSKLYVVCCGGNGVAVVDGATNTVLRTIAVGAGPGALCWNASANRAYVANSDDGTVSVLGAGVK
jgi:YVTN family beta-propeller protein